MTNPNIPSPAVELLAPAGDDESLRAAIANGADAVYLGLRQFNARLRANNFDAEHLHETVALCHQHNVRLYLTLNTLVLPDEWASAEALACLTANAGVDAVIIQDAGLADWFHRRIPSMPIHASTQMTLSEPEAIRWAQEHLGIRRVILPRELTTGEIQSIRAQTTVELEAFVHGALCISYSGQCHASFFMGGRSANRGACAQPCRLPYSLLENGQPVPTTGRHILSPKDFCGLDFIQERIEAGVTCFKIEGRLKNADYVAATVAAYRDAIRAAQQSRAASTERNRQALEILFARGQTSGYVHGDQHAELVDPRLVGHQGLYLGTLTRVGRRSVFLEAAPDLLFPPQPGDGVAFDYPDAEGRRAGARIYQAQRVSESENGPIVYELGFGHDDVDLATLHPGVSLWKTSDPVLDRTLRQSYAKITTPHPVRLDFTLLAARGRPVVLTGRDAQGHEAHVESEHPLEPSRTHPITPELLAGQLERLGNTPFGIGTIELRDDKEPVQQIELMLPKSILNDLRRRVVEQLIEQRKTDHQHVILPGEPMESEPPILSAERPLLKWLVRSEEQLSALLDHAGQIKFPMVITPELSTPEATRLAFLRVREAGIAAGLAAPRVITESQAHLIEEQAALQPDQYLARSWGAVRRMQHLYPAARITGDFSLNIANARAAAVALRSGLAALTPALELTDAQQLALARQVGFGGMEWLVFHHPTLFFTQYCLYAHHVGTGKQYPECGKTCRTRQFTLEDRKGVAYEAVRDQAGRIQIMRTDPVNTERRLESDEWRDSAAFRFELLREDYNQTVELAAGAADRLHAADSGSTDDDEHP